MVSASYGDPADPVRRMDVTELVRRDLSRGATTITPQNAWAGRDPAVQTRKKLYVVIRHPGGQEEPLEVWEGEPLLLVNPAVAPQPACEILDGGKRLLAREPGVYGVTRGDGTTSTWETRAPRSVPVEGPWSLAFPAGWGAPEAVHLNQLMSWTELDLSPEARAFSGTGT